MSTLASEKARWLGTWRNERGSVLRIKNIIQVVVPGGSGTPHYRVDGTYKTAKGSVPPTEKFPVTGFVTEDQIVFAASFRYIPPETEDDDDHTMTAWAGQILPLPDDPDKQALQTLWHLVPSLNEGDEEEGYGWVIAWAGEDRFIRLSANPDFEIPED